MCLPNILSPVFMLIRFYFSLPLIFTLLIASISHCLTAALNFYFFFLKKFVSFAFNHSL